MTSTRRMTGTGLKKCMPMTCPGRLVRAARRVMEMEEVLEARMAAGGRMRSRVRKSSDLISKRSVAASTHRVTGARGASASDSSEVVVVIAAGGFVGLLLGEFGLGDFASEVLLDGVETALQGGGGHVGEHHRMAGAGEDVGDAVAHGAGTDDGDGGFLHRG